LQPNQIVQGKSDQYIIEGPLGEGGFGLTYRARRSSDDLAVVVKLLRLERAGDWKSVELFEREAAIMRGLSHPRIPQYIDTFTIEPAGFGLVQGLIEGQTLKAIMRQKQRLSPEQMNRWLWQMLEVCHYLHTQSPPVIHRDISPKNIILTPSQDAVLIDFGTVQAKISSQESVSSTSAGTFGYAPMEQFVGRALPSSDLYGLGMTFLAVATGREPEQLPFAGNRINVREALAGISVDARILLALDRMTHPDPTGRAESAQELMERLRGIYQESPKKQRAPQQTIAGRICFKCEKQVGFEEQFCSYCGADLNPNNWHQLLTEEAPTDSMPKMAPGQAVSSPPPSDNQSWRAAMATSAHWRDVAARLSQIPPENLLAARPGIPLGDLEFVAINDAATHALLVSYEGFYLLYINEMRVVRLFTEEHISGRVGAFSPDGSRLLVADCYGPVLYFVDIPEAGEPTIRAFQCPEINEFRGDCSIAVSPDHQLAAIAGEEKPILLLDWASGGIADRIDWPSPEDDQAKLQFSPDGSLLFCTIEKKTFLFDTQGNRQEILASHVAISPDGRRMAAFLYDKPEDGDSYGKELGLFVGNITRLSPFSWDPKPFKHRTDRDDLHGMRFSADGSKLLLHMYISHDGDDHYVLDIVATGQPVKTIYEPLYPNKHFDDIKHFAMTKGGLLALFGRVRPSYYNNETVDALLFIDTQSTPRYTGAIQMVKRTTEVGGSNVFIGGKQVSAGALGPNVIINQAPQTDEVTRALTMFAAGGNDPDISLPFGQTPTGFFGRLDQPIAIGANDWSCPLEHPELAQRAIHGEDERALLTGVELLARDDFEERLRFWHSLRSEKTDVRSLLHASKGLTHLLPAVVTRAAEASKGKARFGRAESAAPSDPAMIESCKQLSGYSEAERQAIFEEMCARLDAEAKAKALADKIKAQTPKASSEPSKKREKPKAEAPVDVAPEPPSAPPSPTRGATQAQIDLLESMDLFADGYVALLILPLCEVLWADGTPQAAEVGIVQSYLTPLVEKHPSAGMAGTWLLEKPNAEFFERGRSLLRELVVANAYPELTKEKLQEVVALCQKIASAAGGFLGIGKVSKEEKSTLARIEATLLGGL
jgi:serine/threonine protein kinase